MPGIGTIVNCAAVAAGGLLGMLCSKIMRDAIREAVIKAIGIAVVFLGISGTLSYMLVIKADGSLSTYGVIMLVVSLAMGTLIGELIGIEKGLELLGASLKKRFGKNDSRFVNAFMDTSLVVCVGAMAIVGSIQDGLAGDPSTLYAKSLIDFITVLMMAGGMGTGCIFAFVPVAIVQGSITLLSGLLEPVLNIGTAINDIALVGNAMISCVGLNMAFGKHFRVANMIPGLLVALSWSLIAYYIG